MVRLQETELKKRLKKIKLVVSDVDGTLVNGENKVGELTKEYVKKLREKDVRLTFATQRIFSSIAPIAEELDLSYPLITVNGALIQDMQGNVIKRSVIAEKHIDKALALAQKYFVRIAFVHKDDIVYTEDNSVLKDFMFRLGSNYILVDNYDDYKKDVLEIIMMGNEKPVVKYIQKKLNFPFRLINYAKYYRSSSSLGVYHLEIRRSGVDKQTGLKVVARHLGLHKSEIAVIGDWYNDRVLFEFGGFNVALQNAIPELKHMAHYVTENSNEDDGVGEFMKLLYESK